MEIKDQLAAILAQLTEQKAAAEVEQKKFGTMLQETKDKLTALQTQADALDVKLAERHAAAQPEESFSAFLQKQEGVQRLMKDRSGQTIINLGPLQMKQVMERKTTVDSAAVGVATTGILQIDRTLGIVREARQALTVRDLLTSRPTTMQVVDFVKVNSPMVRASPQIETHTKLENAVTFTPVSEKVRTLATYIPASRQVLADWTELDGFLRSSLSYYVNLAEEQQMLTGSGSGEDLHGLITQATAFSTALLPLSGSYNRIDYIGRVIQQITSAKELQPTFIVLNPVDWWSIRLTKDTQGRYILGDPMGPVAQQQLFGLTPVVTATIASGTFLVGSGVPAAAEIRDREEMQIEIATQHSTQFVENVVTIRCEKRLVLVVYRPASFITGTFTTSP